MYVELKEKLKTAHLPSLPIGSFKTLNLSFLVMCFHKENFREVLLFKVEGQKVYKMFLRLRRLPCLLEESFMFRPFIEFYKSNVVKFSREQKIRIGK